MLEKHEKTKKSDKPFLKEIKSSVILHALILGAFSIKSVFFSSPNIEYQSAIRVDIVDLPDKITSPQAATKPPEPAKTLKPPTPVKPSPPTPPKPKPEVKDKKPEAKVVPKAEAKKDVKDTQKNALDRLKALEQIQNTVNTERAQNDAIERLKQQEYRGNVLAAGNSLSGTDKFQFDAYIGQLDTHVKGYWDLPRWLSEEDLRATVKVKIDARGFVIFRQVISSSGNPAYDEVALQTVDKASPFPMPPPKFRGSLENNGFNIEFQKQGD